jgi:cholesterol oxidase
MGRDVPDGRLFLRDGMLESDWSMRTSMTYYRSLRAAMQALAAGLGARYRDNPYWWFRRVITVHPVGGTPMGDNPARSVVDSHGEAWHYPGLFVADGSVMPGPVGPNPSLTIAALADRFADRMVEPVGAGR